MPEPIVALESLRYRYPANDAPALDHVELTIKEGEFVLLAGASASGKSTLLRAINGLVPHFFGGELGGRALIGGLDTRRCGPAGIAMVAASVFQDPESQVVMNTVRAELSLPLENRGDSPRAIVRAVEETALALGIADLLDRPVHTLSGGELQKVALGAAIAGRPLLLLLDEPTAQLDPVAGDELVWQLRRLNEEWGTTILLAEQRLERCLGAADRVLVLDRGRIVLDAPPERFVAWAVSEAPALAPPLATMFALARLRPLPVDVKQGRALIRASGLAGEEDGVAPRPRPSRSRARRFRRTRTESGPALELDRVSVEYDDGTGSPIAALRELSLAVERGETLALLGRNGAGKSTLLRAAAGISRLRAGRVRAAAGIALVLQNPGDYFLHERVLDELPRGLAEQALAEVGLAGAGSANPRDLSGSERQRLAIAIVLAGRGIGGGEPPGAVALDEPTRGMDREQKEVLAAMLRGFADNGSAVLVATQDLQFAASVADRSVLLAEGRVIADGATRDVLSGGRYFATDIARVLGGSGRAVLPEQGADLLRERIDSRRTDHAPSEVESVETVR